MIGATIPFTDCCAHIYSISYSFKLQFYVHPEDRWHPDYRTPSASTSTETLPDADSRLPAADAHTQADEPTHSSAASSSPVAASLGLPDCPSSPAATEHADSRPTTPRQQQLGDGFSVVPGPSRVLQRERPFSVAPDPMWNSSREIQPDERLATRPPPPPYVLPPTYAEVVPGEIGTFEEVVHPEPLPVETIEIDPSTLQSPTLDVRGVSVSSSNIPHVPVTEEEAHTNPSHSFGPSWAFQSTTQAQNSAASEDEPADGVDADDENPIVESQLSEKARGKKRMRDEDETDDLEDLGGGCSSGSTSSDGDGQPDRKRMKTDTDTDTRVNTDRLEVDESFLIVARMGLFETLTDVESWRQVKKLKEIEKLYRNDRLLA